jgi:hypothetical protein
MVWCWELQNKTGSEKIHGENCDSWIKDQRTQATRAKGRKIVKHEEQIPIWGKNKRHTTKYKNKIFIALQSTITYDSTEVTVLPPSFD